MTATRPGCARAFFRRAALLTVFLAIVAGILGMHIMTGAHTMPTAAAGTTMEVPQPQGVGHTGHAPLQSSPRGTETEPATASRPDGVSGQASSCADTSGCTSMSAMDAVCVLSPANTSLSAPLPGLTPLQAPDTSGAAAASTGYSYLPGSPSPRDLCISRT